MNSLYRMIAIAALVLGALQANAQIEVGGLKAVAGERVTGFIDITDNGDGGSRVPVSIIQGRSNGPTLALVAGTHGYEYAPVIGLQKAARLIDPAMLSGTVIIVHVANMPSFLGRTIYYSPVDGENMNRVYPGKADGTVSERIAHAITTQVIEQADYLVDMHSGDGNEDLRPYIYMPVTGNAEMDAKIKGMALAFGLDHIVIDRRENLPADASRFTDMTGLTRGIPSMTTEAGRVGSTAPELVRKNAEGVMNLLRHLKMLPGNEKPPQPTVWLGDFTVITSPADGIFAARVKGGYTVAKDGVLGELVDYFGEPIATIRAPYAGMVNYVIATPPMRKGEPVAMVSKIVEGE
ncbi:M14 family metallopeptidase [Kordiimonas aquimaris]|uniref:M14 family metallopeptidase n=1 Tax=Kordiimonas aquimaris TaxID=707591 RepID=UPI0021CF3C57|nr:M14 family metallopeptidase [Kordiimonas aquimaris]